MVRKAARWGRIERTAKAGGLGLMVFLLSGWAVVRGQQPAASPAPAPLLAAKDATTRPSSTNTPPAPTSDYTISPEDLLDVNVLGVPEVTREYRVSSNGFLTLPLLPEPVPAAGATLDQLQRLIAAKYREAGMLNDAVVTVSLRETRRHTILVSGEVVRPAAVPVFGPTHLLDVLIQVGGLTADAGNNVIVMRGEPGLRAEAAAGTPAGANPAGQSLTLDIRKLMQVGDDVTNVLLYPGDRVTVQRAELVYILGAVNRPGGYVLNESRQDVTVLKALAMAGDVTNVAKKQRITILRRDPALPEDKRKEIPVDFKAMLKGQIADIHLKPDDILYVPESRSIKAWHTSVNTAMSFVTAGASTMMIYH